MEGSFQCSCNEGFTLSASGDTCIDTDECTVIPNTCGNGTCINTFGSYRCRCNYGFQMSSDNTCQDIDECRSRYNICRNGRCKNTKGSFTCECTDGYELSYDGKFFRIGIFHRKKCKAHFKKLLKVTMKIETLFYSIVKL